MAIRELLRVSVLRTLCLSLRFRGRVIVFRGTRIRLQKGARIQIAPGGHLTLGRQFSGARCSLRIDRNGRLLIGGRVAVSQGVRVQIGDDATLELGDSTFININSSIMCKERITIGTNCAIAWNVNILDGNMHELNIRGISWPLSTPIDIGDHVWIGTGATVIGASIGDGAVIGADSLVTSAVPAKSLVTGNPAHVAAKDVSWVY